ncbi:hypothetical protein C7T94_14170 [Pedobacter yulinensis]|uniref:Signal transduction histidine kinase internal region domain-containing protein n=1 Tax=Pedobacter yulinensis TaxID=2126353 RepID=A0A2T3HML1_9SPHI|nr:histidine kinase [Pedobacter yulinensis]PST83674.1 hypothetical protein C7T94_14170 [Pedobacter yulinensis]
MSDGRLIARKYFIIELLFLLLICYLIPVISDIEYSYYEEKNFLNFARAMEYRLVYGTFSFFFYGLYYWLFLKRYLFKKRTFHLILSVVAFILISHVYNKYENWLVSNMNFLSDSLRLRALQDYRETKLYFIVSYIVSRIVFTLVGFAYLIRSLQQEEEVRTLKEQQLLSELNYLKAQLHPHFFFNTLNNIYALALRGSSSTAIVVAKLSEMMRYILYDASQKLVPLSKEINFLTNFVELEKIRHFDNITIDFEVQGVPGDKMIEPLLLLPIIENAFKHGIREELTTGFVQIVILIADPELTLQVENSKPQTEYPPAHSGGLGLTNLVKRLELLYGKEKHRIDICDNHHTYQVILSLKTHDYLYNRR